MEITYCRISSLPTINSDLVHIQFRGLKDPEFGTQIIQNLQDRTFGINHGGEITLVLGKETELTLDGDVWIKLLNDIIKIKQELDNISFLNFSSKLVDEYASMQKDIQNGSVSADSDKKRLIDQGTALSIGNLMDVGQRSEIDKFRLEILEFTNNEFIGMKTSEVKKLLEDILAKKKDWINDYISDNTVLSWKKMENFVIFADLLSGMTGQRQFTDRAVRLYDLSGHVRTWIDDSLSLQDPVSQMGSRLNSKQEKKYPLLNMMYKFSLKIITNARSGGLDDKDTENFMNLKIFTQALELSGSVFGEIFENERNSNTKNTATNTLFKLWKLLNSNTHKILEQLRAINQLEDIQANIVDQIIASLDIFKMNPKSIHESPGKDFVRNLLYLQSLCEDPIAFNEELQNYPSLQRLGAFKLDSVTDYPQFFMPDLPTDKEERIWRDGNKQKLFYPKQKDPLSQLTLVGELLENFQLHDDLHELLSGFYHPDYGRPGTGDEIYWNNDGFGKILSFGDWIARNKEFQDFLLNGAKTEPYTIILLDKFDLDSRLNRYMDVIKAIHKVLLKRLTPRSGTDAPKTSSPKEFIRDVILKLFNLKEKAKQSRPNGGHVEFSIGVFSRGSLTIDVAQKGKISETKVGDFFKTHDFVRLVYDLIGFNGSGKLNIEDSIESIKYHIELFNQYLNRHRKETVEQLDVLEMQGHIIDEGLRRFLDGNSIEEEGDLKEQDPLIDSINEVLEKDEGELEEFAEPLDQESKEFDYDIDDYDREVLLYWGDKLTEKAWVEMEEHRKQFYRDEYEKLG